MVLYEDPHIILDEVALTIKHYYFPVGSKRVPYETIRAVHDREMDFWTGKWRIWGFRVAPEWFHLDWNRPGKTRCLILDTEQGWLRPVITPESHQQVLAILRDKLGEERIEVG